MERNHIKKHYTTSDKLRTNRAYGRAIRYKKDLNIDPDEDPELFKEKLKIDENKYDYLVQERLEEENKKDEVLERVYRIYPDYEVGDKIVNKKRDKKYTICDIAISLVNEERIFYSCTDRDANSKLFIQNNLNEFLDKEFYRVEK